MTVSNLPQNSNFSGHSDKFWVKKKEVVVLFYIWSEEFLVSRGIILCIQQHGPVPQRELGHTCKRNFCKGVGFLVAENSAVVEFHRL